MTVGSFKQLLRGINNGFYLRAVKDDGSLYIPKVVVDYDKQLVIIVEDPDAILDSYPETYPNFYIDPQYNPANDTENHGPYSI